MANHLVLCSISTSNHGLFLFYLENIWKFMLQASLQDRIQRDSVSTALNSLFLDVVLFTVSILNLNVEVVWIGTIFLS